MDKKGWDGKIEKDTLAESSAQVMGLKKEDVATGLFDKNSAQDFTAYLKNELINRYPDMYVKFTRAPLGDNSVVLYASLEPKETWSNGIFENSDYFIMEIYTDGTMEKTLTSFYQKGKRFGKDSRVKVSFPRQKAVNREDIVKRLFKFIDNAKKAIDVEIG